MYSIKNLANKSLKKDLLEQFLEFANDKLAIDKPYSVYFVNDKDNASDALGKTAMYNPSTNSVYVYVTNRHPKDILRSIAHELMHHKQNCEGRLDKTYGEGSDNLEKLELEANEAGYLVRQFEDGLNENKVNEAQSRKKSTVDRFATELANRWTDLFGDVAGYYPEFYKSIRGLLDRDPPSLRNDPEGAPKIKASPGGVEIDVDTGIKYGAYKKCLSSQEKRKDGRCYPTGFSKNKTFYDFDNLTLKDFYYVNQDIIKTTKKGRESVFKGQDKTLYFSQIVLPRLIITFNTVEKIPKVSENYISDRKKVLDIIKKSSEKLKKLIAKDIADKNAKERLKSLERFGSYLKLESLSEQENNKGKKTPFYLHNQNEIDEARRIYKLYETGIYEFGPPDQPFKTKYKIRQDILNDLNKITGGKLTKERIKELTQVYSVNASSEAAISTEEESILTLIHIILDILGLSADTYGIGIAADVINALIFFAEGRIFDGTLSLAAAAFFGDAAKVSRGPLVKMTRMLSDFQTNAGYFVDQRVIQALVDSMEYIYRDILAKIAGFFATGQTTGGGVGPKVAEFFMKAVKNRMLPGFDEGVETFEQLLDVFKEYNKALRKINKEAREGLDPRKVQELFSNEEDVIEALAAALQKRADTAWKAGKPARGAVKPTQDYRKDRAALTTQINNADTKIGKLQQQLKTAQKNKEKLKAKNRSTQLTDVFIFDLNGRIADQITAKNTLETARAALPKEGTTTVSAIEKAKQLLKNNPGLKEQIINELKKEARGSGVALAFKQSLERLVKTSPDPESAAKSVTKFIDNNYDEFLKETVKVLASETKSMKELINRNLISIVGKTAATVVRQGAAATTAAVKPAVKFASKNVLGTAGLGGEIYKKMIARFFRRFKRINFSSASRVIGTLLDLYISSLPLIIMGKLATLNNYYVRYYRYMCGDSDDFLRAITPGIERIIKFWLTPADLVGQFIPGDVAGSEKRIESNRKFINDMLASQADMPLDEFIIKKITGPFKCKRKRKTTSIVERIRNPSVASEINALIQSFDTQAASEAAASAVAHGQRAAQVVGDLTNGALTKVPTQEDIKGAFDKVGQIVKDSSTPEKFSDSVKKSAKEVINYIDSKMSDKSVSKEDKEKLKAIRGQYAPFVNANFPGLEENLKKQNDSLSDYRKKVLEERLVKLTIGLTK